MRPGERTAVLILSCLLMYIGGIFLSNCMEKYRKQILRINLFIWLTLYVFLLAELTLFDTYFHRNGLSILNWNRELLINYINRSFQCIPFSTIRYFIAGYINGSIAPHVFMYNILGNLIALTPFSFFLPLLFKRQQIFKNFCFTILIIVFCIEGLQFVTLSGTCDIDDVILNALGAYIMYGIFRIGVVKRFVSNILLWQSRR